MGGLNTTEAEYLWEISSIAQLSGGPTSGLEVWYIPSDPLLQTHKYTVSPSFSNFHIYDGPCHSNAMLMLGKLHPTFFKSLELYHSHPPPPQISQCELRLCLLQGSPGSLVAPPCTSTAFSVQGATLPWVTLPQRAKVATWLEVRTRSQRPTWDSSPTRAWDESKPPPTESCRGRAGKQRLRGARMIGD